MLLAGVAFLWPAKYRTRNGWTPKHTKRHETQTQSTLSFTPFDLGGLTYFSLLVIKRRIAWLIGTLVTNSCISATIPRTWETLVFLLRDSSSDFAVKLTATTAIGVCVGVSEPSHSNFFHCSSSQCQGDHFDTEIVAPYLPYIIAELVSLLSDCATLEVKRRVVHALNNVLQECGSSVKLSLQNSDFVLIS